MNDIGNMQNVSSSETSDMDWSEKIMELADEANVGYMFEIDLEYPQTIHDYHDTYTVPNNEDTHVRRYRKPVTIQICVDLHVVDTDDRRFKRV